MKYLLSGLLLLGATKFACADVIYTTRYMEPGEVLSRQPETRILAKNGLRLEERWHWNYTAFTKETTLTSFTKKEQYVMDDILKIYKVVPFPSSKNETADNSGEKPPAITVKLLGEEQLLGFKTKHFQADWKYELKNASPDADRQIHIELWLVPAADMKALPVDETPDFASIGPVAGDKELWQQAKSGLAVRTKISRPSKTEAGKYSEVYTEEVTSFSRSELEDSLFEIPQGYKMVTAEEFDRARRAWREKKMDR